MSEHDVCPWCKAPTERAVKMMDLRWGNGPVLAIAVEHFKCTECGDSFASTEQLDGAIAQVRKATEIGAEIVGIPPEQIKPATGSLEGRDEK